MKRSEALEEIRKILSMNGKDDGMGELEEALLHTMEVRGMLPPPTKTDVVTDCLVYCYYPKTTECKGNIYYSVLDTANSQLWEPEDE